MPQRFAAIEPYDAGMLDVGDGQRIYWGQVRQVISRPSASGNRTET